MRYNKNKKDINQKIKNIQFLLSDVDGVLTDGSLFVGSDGTEYKKFHVEDHSGIVLLQLAKIPVGFLSARFSKTTSIRAKEMKVDICIQGALNKAKFFKEICKENNLSSNQVAYVGDGLIDIPVMNLAGLSIAVNNADDRVKKAADIITHLNGGEGVLKELANFILTEQNKIDDAMRIMKEKIYDA